MKIIIKNASMHTVSNLFYTVGQYNKVELCYTQDNGISEITFNGCPQDLKQLLQSRLQSFIVEDSTDTELPQSIEIA